MPTAAHERHSPVQAVAQQTPCSQKPEAHSVADAHREAGAFLGAQVPLLQMLAVAQPALLVHFARHAVAEGAQA